MASLNKAMIIGRLGNDPDSRVTPTGKTVVTFSVATGDSYRGADGNRVEKTEWHRVVVWEKLADICKEFLSKGKQVYIEGRLQTRSWQDKETDQKKYTTEIVASNMVMLGSSKDQHSKSENIQEGGASEGGSEKAEGEEDDLPF